MPPLRWHRLDFAAVDLDQLRGVFVTAAEAGFEPAAERAAEALIARADATPEDRWEAWSLLEDRAATTVEKLTVLGHLREIAKTLEVNDGMLDSLPVRIISSRSFIRSVNEGPPGWNETLQQKFVDYWERNQSALIKLSANSKRIILDSSGHAMHVTQPAVVIETILSVMLDQLPE